MERLAAAAAATMTITEAKSGSDDSNGSCFYGRLKEVDIVVSVLILVTALIVQEVITC